MISKTATKLSAGERKALSRTQFALPELRKYPIHDESHARTALAYVSRFGSADQQTRVRAAVAKKYPHIGGSE